MFCAGMSGGGRWWRSLRGGGRGVGSRVGCRSFG